MDWRTAVPQHPVIRSVAKDLRCSDRMGRATRRRCFGCGLSMTDVTRRSSAYRVEHGTIRPPSTRSSRSSTSSTRVCRGNNRAQRPPTGRRRTRLGPGPRRLLCFRVRGDQALGQRPCYPQYGYAVRLSRTAVLARGPSCSHPFLTGFRGVRVTVIAFQQTTCQV